MFCQKCGTENKDDASFCNSCGVALGPAPATSQGAVKQNAVIQAKIKTKQDQFDAIGHVGPVILVVIGFLLCLTLIGIVFGVILMAIGIWWSSVRENEKKKLQNEIAELRAELEA